MRRPLGSLECFTDVQEVEEVVEEGCVEDGGRIIVAWEAADGQLAAPQIDKDVPSTGRKPRLR